MEGGMMVLPCAWLRSRAARDISSIVLSIYYPRKVPLEQSFYEPHPSMNPIIP